MPSPFPGMDPYLEEPSLWPNLHQRLITYAADSLAAQLGEDYWVHMGERVYVSEPDRTIYPDVSLARMPASSRAPQGASTAAILDTDSPVLLILPDVEVREPFLEILDAATRHVVTVIEILSPANKAPGEGQDLYLEKQRQVLASDANLVELDLLRRGAPTVAGAPLLPSLGAYHYLVCVSRPANRKAFLFYPVTVRDRLPRVEIPLRPGAPKVGLDLKALLDQAYDNGRYRRVLDYTRDPDPPFGAADAAWVRRTVEAG